MFIKFDIESSQLLKRHAKLLWLFIKYKFNLQSRKIPSNTAMNLACQSLSYDDCPDRKLVSKKIPKYYWFQPLVLPGSFQNMGKQ